MVTRQKLGDATAPHGRVHWEIEDSSGRVVRSGDGYFERWYTRFVPLMLRDWIFDRYPRLLGTRNAVLNTMRNNLADALIGTSITFPNFIGIATGTGSVSATDIALDTPVDYDGANEAKITTSRSLRGQFTSRIVTQFSTTEANQNIRQLGLFDAANSGVLWAKVRVTIDKVNTERLTIYWYFTFERRAGLALKSGTSVSATGATANGSWTTLSFASNVTVLMIENNSGGVIYFNLNGNGGAGNPPASYDFRVVDGGRIELLNEEIDISAVHSFATEIITLPDNQLSVKGW